MGRGTFCCARLLKAPGTLNLGTSRDEAATTSLGNLCQGLINLTVKNFFLISHVTLLPVRVKPFLLILGNHLSSSFLLAPSGTGRPQGGHPKTSPLQAEKYILDTRDFPNLALIKSHHFLAPSCSTTVSRCCSDSISADFGLLLTLSQSRSNKNPRFTPHPTYFPCSHAQMEAYMYFAYTISNRKIAERKLKQNRRLLTESKSSNLKQLGHILCFR